MECFPISNSDLTSPPSLCSPLQVPLQHREKGCELRIGKDVFALAYSRESMIAAKEVAAREALRKMAEGKVRDRRWGGAERIGSDMSGSNSMEWN